MSVDVRTRNTGAAAVVDPAVFWADDWAEALEAHGARAAADAEHLGLAPLTIRVDGDARTLTPRDGRIDAVAGAEAALAVGLDRAAFTDLVLERRTALGLAVAGRVEGDGVANQMFCAWDPVLRSVLDGRAVYRPGDVALHALDGTDLALDQEFRLGEDPQAAAHFLAETGFMLLREVFTGAEMAAIDDDLSRAVEAARPDDGTSWWAATSEGVQYPCRILDFAQQSGHLRRRFGDDRYLAIGQILDDGHAPGDPFGEHFSEVTAEGLVKRVGSVEGLACLPWHKDCERGGHSMFCCGITIGICLTPVDEAHGGLDVVAGSHRSNIARTQFDAGLDLPTVELRAARGDVTVHLSCTLHRSTHPRRTERRVAYSGFALPPRPGDRSDAVDRSVLARQRAELAGGQERAGFLAAPKPDRSA
ncbi:MAG TPA: phytanoyl-CoA dioxygenase family protein [Acidimicrobiia bacterium]